MYMAPEHDPRRRLHRSVVSPALQLGHNELEIRAIEIAPLIQKRLLSV